MLQILIIAIVIVALAVLLLGINIFVFGRKFPETEVGQNKNMIRLGLRCPQCEEKARYRQSKPVRLRPSELKPDWKAIGTV
ncbi:MAG: hypothetical protein JXA72_08585 [Bacteroidales bacterium]|nr:hypothetical protein [Bacteroidales bacterium]